MQQNTIETSKPWISFTVEGLQNISVYGESYSFETINDDLIEEIQILQEENSITGIICILKDVKSINDDIFQQVCSKVKIFFVNMYGKYLPVLSNFKIQPSGTYHPHPLETDSPQINEFIRFDVDISMTMQYKIETFKNLFDSKFLSPDKEDDYMLLYHTMTIDNIVTRYLMLYEILLSHVPASNPKKHLQTDVTDYIKNVYNPQHPTEQIGFHQTRKPGKLYDEDDITYFRNLLGHNDSSSAVKVNDTTILEHCNKLTRILYFKLTKEN